MPRFDSDVVIARRFAIDNGVSLRQEIPLVEADDVADGPTTTSVLAIGGSAIANTIDADGDGDWFRVDLVAGQSYAFTVNGSGASPLLDPYLAVHEAFTTLSIDDDGGDGANALMHFTATQTGTYYLAVHSSGGTGTGEYTVSAALGQPQNPLDTLDLGFTFYTNNIDIYFATSGQQFGPTGAALRSWTTAEQFAVTNALRSISNVANLTFTVVGSQSEADFTLTLADLPSGVLGVTYYDPIDAYIEFDPLAPGWTTQGLGYGGLGYSVILHEILHGLGLDHPHMDGGDTQVMQGVTNIFNSFGTFGLNQQVFTIMSYNDGWPQGPDGQTPSADYGFAASPMALDVAFLQMLYGANTTNLNTNTTYGFPDNPIDGRYSTIWDTGGVDLIDYDGSNDVTINLNAATLQNAVGGGGYVSFVDGIYGGFTIAHGVVIENAYGNNGNDTLIGNEVANVLRGYDADDNLSGSGGNDTLDGSNGVDRLDGGAGVDQMTGGSGNDTYYVDDPNDVVIELANGGIDSVNISASSWVASANVENVWLYGAGISATGNALDNSVLGTSGNNFLYGLGGTDRMSGMAGNDYVDGGDGDDTLGVTRTIHFGAESNTYIGGAGFDWLEVLTSGDGIVINFATGEISGVVAGLDTFTGIEGVRASFDQDTIIGDGAAQRIMTRGGGDTVDGAGGVDTLDYSDGNGVLNLNMIAGTGTIGVYTDTFTNIENIVGTQYWDTIIGDNGANRIEGGTGSDTISGGGGNDVLVAGDGNDALSGDSGMDTSVYAATSSSISWSRNPNGTWSVNVGANNIDTLTSVEYLDFTDRDVFLDRAYSTFSGDGTSDILMRHANGNLGVWFVGGSGVTGAAGLGGIDNTWAIEGVGDFNGDGRDDIFMRATNGNIGTWFMNGASASGAAGLGNIDLSWDIAGLGDLNGDGFDDMVMWNTNGSLGVWFMNNGAVSGAAGLGNISQATFDFEALGDFNGDGKDDILWRNSSGDVGIWFMDGGTATGAGIGNIAMSWAIEGTGDFNGDGRDDILMRDASGNLGAWFMNGASATGAGLGNVSTDFAVAAVGDYNGDGRDDILWWHNNGSLSSWFMNGAAATATSYGSVSHDWVINPGG